jgi:hypothetical protein
MTICVICGQNFHSNNPRCKTCSPECSKEYQRQLNAKWRAEHPEKAKALAAKNAPKYVQQRKKWRSEHPELVALYNKRYYDKKHPEQEYALLE